MKTKDTPRSDAELNEFFWINSLWIKSTRLTFRDNDICSSCKKPIGNGTLTGHGSIGHMCASCSIKWIEKNIEELISMKEFIKSRIKDNPDVYAIQDEIGLKFSIINKLDAENE